LYLDWTLVGGITTEGHWIRAQPIGVSFARVYATYVIDTYQHDQSSRYASFPRNRVEIQNSPLHHHSVSFPAAPAPVLVAVASTDSSPRPLPLPLPLSSPPPRFRARNHDGKYSGTLSGILGNCFNSFPRTTREGDTPLVRSGIAQKNREDLRRSYSTQLVTRKIGNDTIIAVRRRAVGLYLSGSLPGG
jgi:hypothetical protein